MSGIFLKQIVTALVFAIPGKLSTWMLTEQADASTSRRVQTVLTADLPPNMNGHHLRTTLITVRYGPGDASPPHSHVCPVIVYVLEGTVRSEIKGQPELSYHAGESFYEPPGGSHLISANASKTRPARFLAFFVCDHDAPLSSDSSRDGSGGVR